MRRIFGLFLVAAVASCSGTESGLEGSDAPMEAAEPDAATTDPGDSGKPFLGDATGTWVQVQERHGAGRIFGEVYSDRMNRSFFLVKAVQDGEDLSAMYQACHVEVENMDSTSQAVTTIPKALVESIPVGNRPARVFQDDLVWRFNQPAHVDVRGIKLQEPASDLLPLDREDERIWDQDEDGQPGVTVWVDGPGLNFDLSVIQRINTTLIGSVVSDDRIEGLIQWTEDQVIIDVIGATPDMAALIVGESNVLPDLEPDRSRFRMFRVDAGTTCGDVMDRRDDWLGW